MNMRRNKSQVLAAAKAGISERSARRIEFCPLNYPHRAHVVIGAREPIRLPRFGIARTCRC